MSTPGARTSNSNNGARPLSPIEMATTNDNSHVMHHSDTAPILEYDQNLVGNGPSDADTSPDHDVQIREPRAKLTKCLAFMTVIILCIINLLNYMDRFTVSGVLLQIQDDFNIDNSQAGLLQTAFICSYMILSPIFGYLGDRCSRKAIMTCGILFWSAVTFGSSFVKKDQYWIFLLLRALVGVGEASYSTIAPTIIGDLFVDDQRSNMLAIFYFAIPVGSGLGYIVGANVAKALGNWRWALRVTPGLGVVCIILALVCIREPARGEAEGGSHLRPTSYFTDLKHLCTNASFMFTTFGFTCVAFVAGALAFWAPTYMIYSIRVQQHVADEADVSLKFGIVTCAAGVVGVASGSQIARFYRRFNPRSDPLVCASGMLLCTPFLYASMIVSQYNTTVTWILIFLGETMLCLNWSIVADIVLYVVIPPRRGTAEAFQILISHLLGDAGSPYLVGAISDAIKHNYIGENTSSFVSLQYALYSTTFACVIGGFCFLMVALNVERDKARVEMITKKSGPVVIEGAMSDGLENRHSDDTSDDNIIT